MLLITLMIIILILVIVSLAIVPLTIKKHNDTRRCQNGADIYCYEDWTCPGGQNPVDDYKNAIKNCTPGKEGVLPTGCSATKLSG